MIEKEFTKIYIGIEDRVQECQRRKVKKNTTIIGKKREDTHNKTATKMCPLE